MIDVVPPTFNWSTAVLLIRTFQMELALNMTLPVTLAVPGAPLAGPSENVPVFVKVVRDDPAALANVPTLTRPVAAPGMETIAPSIVPLFVTARAPVVLERAVPGAKMTPLLLRTPEPVIMDET